MVSGPPVLRMGASACSVIVFRAMAVKTARPKRIDLFIGFVTLSAGQKDPPQTPQLFLRRMRCQRTASVSVQFKDSMGCSPTNSELFLLDPFVNHNAATGERRGR